MPADGDHVAAAAERHAVRRGGHRRDPGADGRRRGVRRGVAAAADGPAACSLPVDDMPLAAEYARFSDAGGPPAVSRLYVLLLLVALFGVVAYAL